MFTSRSSWMSPEFKFKVTWRVTLFKLGPPVSVVRSVLALQSILYYVLVGTVAMVCTL